MSNEDTIFKLARLGRTLNDSEDRNLSYHSDYESELILDEQSFSFASTSGISTFTVNYELPYIPRVLVTLKIESGRTLRCPIGYGPIANNILVDVEPAFNTTTIRVTPLSSSGRGEIICKVLASKV